MPKFRPPFEGEPHRRVNVGILPRLLVRENFGREFRAPNTADQVKRKAGSLPNYGYSSAMKGADFVWDKEKLDRFIAKTDEVVPGNNMKPRCGVEEPDHWHSRYLRPRRERATDRRAAEQRDEPDAARRALDRV